MSKPVKEMMTRSVARLYDSIEAACVVDLTGMDAEATHALRGKLRERNMKMQVVKNRIARRAFAEGPLGVLAKSFVGPCALVVGGDSVIDVAKVLVESAKSFPALRLKDGLLDGDVELTPVTQMAGMKSLTETRADLVGLFLSPGRRLAGVVSSGGSNIAACIKSVIEKLEKGEEIRSSAA